MAEKIVELGKVGAIGAWTEGEAAAPESGGRCRIYNSQDELVGCRNLPSEEKCQQWAQYKGAWGYAWAPGSSC
ncbi:MAG TPA: hypothetical protein PKA33_12045 [Amaricoccus sp.]|uniref:hypothetical protein n=1 Tax=Amaricoccus sp. TaxID=1872485 RepID=UPI002CF7ED65|nr:hypothetical protein [Amaricoccus sp.]HMQ95431.1 hypothetical protein [Amaricoccus sp.]HMR53188.1 hypothetical protein [Amaricoccus sp.]HMR61899.1 hypothetical protein [Amaricoccus sp.]HMU00084.1 hypothetical protein [Amaricoccus sp.]